MVAELAQRPRDSLGAFVILEPNMIKISVYIDDGRVFDYEVASPDKAREHTHAIVTTGYRHCQKGLLEHYPPRRITKVKAAGKGIDTTYPDKVRGT